MIETFPFVGVVESQDDPLKLARVQVRLYGYHTDNKQLLPTKKLRWFNSGVSNSASVSGKGVSGLGYKPGSSVFGYCFDSDMQNGIVICSYHGLITEMPNSDFGFSDPNLVLPKEELLNESDVNRLARAETVSETIVATKTEDRYVDIPKGDKTVYTQPETGYDTVYPNNEVIETMSGHIIEFDDTEGARRIHVYHASGSFFEILDDGTVIVKSQSDTYHLSAKSKNLYAKGDLNISSDSNVNIYSGVDTNIHIKGNAVCDIEGNSDITVGGNMTSLVKGDVESTIEGNMTSLVKQNLTSTVEGNSSLSIYGDSDITVKGNMVSVVEGTSDITSVGNLTLTVNGVTNATFKQDLTAVFETNANLNVSGNLTTIVNGDSIQNIQGSANISVGVNANIQVEGNATEVIKGSYSKTIDGSCDIIASGVMTLDGSLINIG